MKRGGSLKQSGAHVVWDEENLGFWEANKTPKQKVDEPKTPYHPPGADDSIPNPTPAQNAVHADAIRLALSDVASTSEGRALGDDPDDGRISTNLPDPAIQRPSHDREPKGMDMDTNNNEPLNQLKRRRSFEEKRHMHHLEYRKAKCYQALIEEDENEHRDQNQPSGSRGSSSTPCREDQESNISKGLCDIDIQDARSSDQHSF